MGNSVGNRNVSINQSGEDNVSVDVAQSTEDTPHLWPVTPERYQEILANYQKDVDKLYTVKWGTHNLMDEIIQGMVDDEGCIHEEDMTLVRNEVRGKVYEVVAKLTQTFVPLFGESFELNVEETGSVPEGTKVSSPNEFDILLVLRAKTVSQSVRLHVDCSHHTENYKTTKLQNYKTTKLQTTDILSCTVERCEWCERFFPRKWNFATKNDI